MAAVVIVVPEDGSEVVAPDLAWLREQVLRGEPDFWCSGSGQAWLKHPEGPELLLAFEAGHGFYPEYIDRRGQYWIPRSAGGGGKVPVWVGGDPIIVCEGFFVTADLAWAAIEEFCATGERTSRVDWVRKSEAGWDYEYWEHPDVKLQ